MIFCFGSKLKASTRSHFPRLFPRKSLCVLLREKRKEKKKSSRGPGVAALERCRLLLNFVMKQLRRFATLHLAVFGSMKKNF